MGIEIYIDGSYRSTTDTGSYGLVLKEKGKEDFVIVREEQNTTNNCMEMKGLLLAFNLIDSLELTEEVTIFCDSQYVVNGFNVWYKDWVRRGFKTAAGHPVKNKELWVQLKAAAENVRFTLTWVKGHADNEGNQQIDKIVQERTNKKSP